MSVWCIRAIPIWLNERLWPAFAAPKGQPCHEKADGAKDLKALARSASP